LKEYDKKYVEDLNESIADAEERRILVSFTMEEFMAYTPKKS